MGHQRARSNQWGKHRSHISASQYLRRKGLGLAEAWVAAQLEPRLAGRSDRMFQVDPRTPGRIVEFTPWEFR
jgi:hypothetical protein